MRERSYLVLVIMLAAALLFGLRASMHSLRDHAIGQLGAATDGATPGAPPITPRPIADTARLLRSLKLVTVEIQTEVESTRTDPSWRGEVSAKVVAPVRLLYGCDLSTIGNASTVSAIGLRTNLLTDGYTLRVPRPRRLAAEVDGSAATAAVQVGWGRFRDVAGEYQLGLARTSLHEQARALVLTHEQREDVEAMTREQLVTLVRTLAAAGRDVPVEIEFVDAGDNLAGASDEPGAAP
jgi:hypothetical protein